MDKQFVEILGKVWNYVFDRSVISFINQRTIHKSRLSLSCLRLYTTRDRVHKANEKDYQQFPGEGKTFKAYDVYVGNERTAKAALWETRLLDMLQLKLNMPVMLIHNFDVSEGWVNVRIEIL